MKGYKEVTKEEFDKFIDEYPRPLERNFFMDWMDYYDFDGAEPDSLEELYSYKVARSFYDWGEIKYYIKVVEG